MATAKSNARQNQPQKPSVLTPVPSQEATSESEFEVLQPVSDDTQTVTDQPFVRSSEVEKPVANDQAIQSGQPKLSLANLHIEWPTSRPGPRKKTPPPGMRPINAIRPEQVAEVGYNQEAGTPAVDSPLRTNPDAREHGATSFDQALTAQEVLGKRKQRL